MELFQVKYFLALCETLNFTRAAENCNVSQPSLTRAIQNLEVEFGGPLFHRERQHTHLTELGKLMQSYFGEVYQQAEAAKTAARSFAKLDGTPLKIGVMCTIGPMMLSEFISGFRALHSGIDLQMIDAPGRALDEMLLRGDIEVGIYGLPEGIDERLHCLPLFRERFVIAINEQHPFATLNAVHCRELDGQPYVNRSNCEFADYAGSVLRQQGVKVKVVLRSDRDDWVQGMVLAGLGFGFFPEFAITFPGIQTRTLIEPEMVRTIGLVTVRGRRHSPSVGALVRAARTHQWPQTAAPAA